MVFFSFRDGSFIALDMGEKHIQNFTDLKLVDEFRDNFRRECINRCRT